MLAMSSLLLIALYLKHELSFDQYHSNSDRIYRLTITSPALFSGKHFARIPGPGFIPAMAESMPGIENYVRLSPVAGGIIQWKEQKNTVTQAFECDSTFFKVFNATLIAGNPEHVLDGPGSMVISESFAGKIFGNTDPVGEILTIPTGRYYGEETNYTVNGIMKDFPDNSHLHPEFVATPLDPASMNDWAWTYLLLYEHANPSDITNSFRDFLSETYEQDPDEIDRIAHLQKITDIHLRSKKTREIESNSSILVVYSFALAALILLFISLINYSNLNLGMAGFSERYLFVSKVFGGTKMIRLKYFAIEGVIIVLVALLISAFVVYSGITTIDKWFHFNLLHGNVWFVVTLALFISLLGFLAGFIPGFRVIFGADDSATDLRNGGKYRSYGTNKALIVIQYTIAIMLIIAVLVIHRQTAFALNSGLGAGNENIICVKYAHSDIVAKFPEFKMELMKYPSIGNVSGMLESPGGDVNDMFRFSMEGYELDESRPHDDFIGIFPCDYSFASLFDLNFLAGENFSKNFEDHEISGEYIINEAAVRRLNYSDPAEIIGKEFQLFFHSDVISIPSGRIIGVVEDFHISSIKRVIEPMVFFKRKDMWIDNLLISFSPGMQTQAMNDFKTVWEEMFPEYTFRFEYIDTIYRDVYLSERLQAILLLLFTVIALFICSMGLMGLSLLETRRRTREIGIRIVNGAHALGIVRMLNRDFLKWIVLSVILATPIAYMAMKRWLEDFVYKTDLSWWIFLLAGATALLISGLTVTIHSWRAARRNPVETLRYE